jgi:BolA protein
MNRADRILAILTQELAPSHLQLRDDSQKHAGHSGAAPGGETHYTLHIVSEAFVGLNKVARHRKIYALLAEEFSGGLHAIAIHAKAPGE